MTGVSDAELLELVGSRQRQVRAFLEWALDRERAATINGESWRSLRLANRPDIGRARTAASWFPDAWWGVVAYTCFDSLTGTEDVRAAFQEPLREADARKALERIRFRRQAVRAHRTQPGVTGAKRALISASENNAFFRAVLHAPDSTFEERYVQLRTRRLPQWGRTTSFDLLVRAGELSISGTRYTPTTAQLAGSTGPQRGFTKIWGVQLGPESFAWGEAVLRAWKKNWEPVAEAVGVIWDAGPPYSAGDFENALCIWQERRS